MKQRIPFPRHIPFVETLKLELWEFGHGRAELQVQADEAFMNSWHVAHGGLVMTMLDAAMAHAARSVTVRHDAGAAPGGPPGSETGLGMVTIEMKTSFMRAAEGRLRAEGRLLHRTATLAFCEGQVFDAEGKLCAHATGTFKYLRALPAGREVKPLQHAGPKGPKP